MSTRRSFLQSAVFLPSLLSAPAFAQDTQSNKFTPFADFEEGWGDWTVEGLAFGTRPATDALFPGKIRGFGGRGFVCTLHPRKGNGATGKATSREFVIEKPLITFKIGGGNFPGQACLNLVVDGKIERTATGDGTANLSDASWDVSALVSKKARLEIVDSTASENRGYVLVDDIQFVEGVVTGGLPLIEIPLRVIQILDARGNAEFFGGDGAVLTPATVARQVKGINKIYQQTGIQFTFNIEDLDIRRDDYLYLDFDAPNAAFDTANRNGKPQETGRSERQKLFQKIGEERKDRVTVIIHRGSEWRWNEQAQKWQFGIGFSHGGSIIASGPMTISGIASRVWAHELGHTLGLPHISKDSVDAPSRMTTEGAVSEACQVYLDKGGDVNHPEYAIDGDYNVGVDDTPPDPGLGFWGNSKVLQATIQITLRDRPPFPLLVSRNNIMAANSDNGGFTNG